MNTDLLLEVRELRDRLADRTDVLEKVKALTLLPDDLHATIDMVASYYEVSRKAIESLIADHRDELDSDGLRTISGKELSFFKEEGVISKNTPSLVIIPRRAILRIGMLLRDSQVAKTVRTYLLNVEEEARVEAPQVIDRAVKRISWREVYESSEKVGNFARSGEPIRNPCGRIPVVEGRMRGLVRISFDLFR